MTLNKPIPVKIDLRELLNKSEEFTYNNDKDSNVIEATIVDSYKTFPLTGLIVKFNFKDSKDYVYQVTATVTDALNGICQVTIPLDAIRYEGYVEFEVVLIDGTTRLTAGRTKFYNKKALDDAGSVVPLNMLHNYETELQNTNDRISNIIAQSGTSDTEVVDARGVFPVLRDRLNAVDLSLAEKANRNELIDYEEGTWTPILIADSGNAVFKKQQGKYIKIGNAINIFCDLELSSKNDLTGKLSISGLPFYTPTIYQTCSVGLFGMINTSIANDILTLYIAGSSIGLYSSTTKGNVTFHRVYDTEIQDNFFINLQGTYFI